MEINRDTQDRLDDGDLIDISLGLGSKVELEDLLRHIQYLRGYVVDRLGDEAVRAALKEQVEAVWEEVAELRELTR